MIDMIISLIYEIVVTKEIPIKEEITSPYSIFRNKSDGLK